MTQERPEVEFSGKVVDITLNKDATVTVRIKVNRYRGLVDELIEIEDRETDFHAVVAVFQPRLANEPIVPKRPVEGCPHKVEARRWHRGDEVCSECGTILGTCTHPEVVGLVGEATATCAICGEKVLKTVGMAEDVPEPEGPEAEERSHTLNRRRRRPVIGSETAPTNTVPEDLASTNGLMPYREAVDKLVEKGYSDEMARKMVLEDVNRGLVARPPNEPSI